MTRKIGIVLGLATLIAVAPAFGSDDAARAALETAVQRAAADAALATVEAPDRFEIVSVRFGGAEQVPDVSPDLEVVDTTGPNAAGMVRVRMRMLDGGETLGEARATVRGAVKGPVLVATETLARGEVVPAESVEVVEADLTKLRSEPVRSLAALGDRVPDRTIGAGRTLEKSLLEARPVVRKGDPVELVVRNGAVTVSATGIARRDGAPGDRIVAVNASSGKELLGEVQPDGSILVTGVVGRRLRP